LHPGPCNVVALPHNMRDLCSWHNVIILLWLMLTKIHGNSDQTRKVIVNDARMTRLYEHQNIELLCFIFSAAALYLHADQTRLY
jgi:hypothetical protein